MTEEDIKKMLHAFHKDAIDTFSKNLEDGYRASTDRYNDILDKHAQIVFGAIVDSER